MTIGQRIAQKRKEMGISQETLGERMGVSRQAIYKWEADATLPEIEKLVALSKLFGVSVGWLLGVEEATVVQPENDELTPTQLKMVSEIVDRYIAAQPQPKKRRKWLWLAAAAVALIPVVSLINWMDQIDNRYFNLQNAVSNITSSVNHQIGNIAGRVEEILQAQNNLTAEFSAGVTDTDYKANTVTLSLEAVPKTYVEGMQAVFLVDNGSGPAEFPGTLGEGLNFAAQAQVPLTDEISASVVFISPDGVRQTQFLDGFYYLLSESYVELNIQDHHLWNLKVTDGKLSLKSLYFTARVIGNYDSVPSVESYRIGLFRNQKLVAWAEPCDKPANFIGFEGEDFHLLPDVVLDDLEVGDILTVAALVTDDCGRQYMDFDVPYVVETDMELGYPDQISYDRDVSDWTFE